MTINLMEHQVRGIQFLTVERYGLLAFEQGLGKTLVAIDSYRRVWASREAQLLLVICPNSLKRNWLAELKKFAPEFTVDIAEGNPRERRRTFAATKANVVITSYETARAEVSAILALVQRHATALVLDESHAAKNWRSLTSIAARQIAPYCQYRWLLSGTPVTNSPLDLFTQIEILEPGARPLGSQELFMASVEQDPEASFAKETFDRYVLRRTKEQCLDLPNKTFINVQVELPPWQRKLYEKMRSDMVCEIQNMEGEAYKAFASTALAKLTRLSQIASNPTLLFPEIVDQPGKFEVIDELLSDMLSVPGRKVIIWSNYVRTIDDLLARYSDYGAVAIYGMTLLHEYL